MSHECGGAVETTRETALRGLEVIASQMQFDDEFMPVVISELSNPFKVDVCAIPALAMSEDDTRNSIEFLAGRVTTDEIVEMSIVIPTFIVEQDSHDRLESVCVFTITRTGVLLDVFRVTRSRVTGIQIREANKTKFTIHEIERRSERDDVQLIMPIVRAIAGQHDIATIQMLESIPTQEVSQ